MLRETSPFGRALLPSADRYQAFQRVTRNSVSLNRRNYPLRKVERSKLSIPGHQRPKMDVAILASRVCALKLQGDH